MLHASHDALYTQRGLEMLASTGQNRVMAGGIIITGTLRSLKWVVQKCLRQLRMRAQGGGEVAVAELGGSVITGIDGNPLAVLAKQLGIPLYEIQTAHVPIYMDDGTPPDTTLDTQVPRPVWARLKSEQPVSLPSLWVVLKFVVQDRDRFCHTHL